MGATTRLLLPSQPPTAASRADAAGCSQGSSLNHELEQLADGKAAGELMANLLDDICDDGPVLSSELTRPIGISKAQIQRCISKLSPHLDDEQLYQVVEMFQAHGLL